MNEHLDTTNVPTTISKLQTDRVLSINILNTYTTND